MSMAKKKIQDNDRLYSFLRPWVDFNARHSYRRYEVHGKENLPKDGAMIFGINHSNTLMDALVVLATSHHKKVFMARGDIFANPTVAKILRFTRILPLFRIRRWNRRLMWCMTAWAFTCSPKVGTAPSTRCCS